MASLKAALTSGAARRSPPVVRWVRGLGAAIGIPAVNGFSGFSGAASGAIPGAGRPAADWGNYQWSAKRRHQGRRAG